MSTTPTLLPCPFCGPAGKPFMSHSTDEDGCYWSFIECRSCGLRTRGCWVSRRSDTCPIHFEEVREAWNRRAALTQGAGEAVEPVADAEKIRISLLSITATTCARLADEMKDLALLLADALEYHVQQTRPIERSTDALAAARAAFGASEERNCRSAEPVVWVSPKQLENLTDPQYDDHGRYLPVRKTSAGLFTAPLYAAPPAQQLQQAVARALAPIQQAIRDYHYALDTRQHGGVAQRQAFEAICEHLGMHWQQGQEAEARAKGTHD